MDEENEQDGYQPNFTEAATQPAMPQQQPPPVPMWTSADDMRFARKSAGMNQVRDDLDAGVLHPQFAMPLLQQYQDDLQGMSQEKMAFDQHQQETAMQTALGQNALKRTVQQRDQEHAADGFLGTMRTFVDPVSGRDAHFYQSEPGKWEQVNFRHTDPTPGGDAGVAEGGEGGGESGGEEQSPPAAEGPPAAQSPFTQTIWNGANRTDTTWQPGQTVGQSSGSWMGIPGAQPPPQANAGDSFGLTDDKKREIQNLAAVNSSHLPPGIQRNSLYSHLVQRLTGQAIQEQGQQRRAAALATSKQNAAASAQVDTDYRDALKNHTLKDYQDSADPHAARQDAIMSDFARLHPTDPRVAQWQTSKTAGMAALAAKKPNAMSLGELATATIGPHANVQKMLEKSEEEIKKDERTIPENTTRGANTYNPTGTATPGPYSAMQPEDVHYEAVQRVKDRLAAQLESQRQAKAPPAAVAPAPPSAQGPVPPSQPAAVPPAGQAEQAQREAVVGDIRNNLMSRANAAGDQEGVTAAFELSNAIERYGSIKNVPAAERDKLLKAKQVLDRYRGK